MTVRIIQMTDTHLMADPLAEIRGICTRARFDAVWNAVQQTQSAAARLIVTGDLTHDEKLETYQILRQSFGDWWPRLRVIPGNHDDRDLMRQVFGDRIDVVAGRNLFVDVVGDWRLIGLDSHVPGALHGQLGAEQLEWLAGQLAESSRPVCLFLHHPPLSVGSPWLDRIGLSDADEFLGLVRRHAAVRLICCGHIHQERMASDRSVTILTTPSTGVQFRPETPQLEVDVVAPGFRIIDLYPDGQFMTRVERIPLESE